MRKSMAAVLVVSLVMLLGTQLVWAASNPCIMQEVDADVANRIERLRAAFKAQRDEIKDKLHALRGSAEHEQMDTLRADMLDLKSRIRAEIRELLPEEWKDQCMPHAPQTTRQSVRQLARHRAGR